jgi:diguanylate cyclase (GGDEF)-like protein
MELAFQEQPDLILLDIMMPEIDGYEVCKRLKSDARTAAIPIIFVSAKGESENIVVGLEAGAVDYVSKPFQVGELKARIGTVCRMIALQERLSAQANTDELTGLYNRRKMGELLEREVLQAKSHVSSLSLLMFDLDHFKSINDSYGHLGGDTVLRQFAQVMSENIYPLDIAARYGGEEFVVIMPDTDREKAVQAAERLLKKVESFTWKISTERLSITTSIGVGTMEIQDSITTEELIKRADTALYYAKNQGRDQVAHWDDIDTDKAIPPQDVSGLECRVSHLAQQLCQQTLGSISALARAIEAKDKYLVNHSENVQAYALAIAHEFGLATDFQEKLSVAAQLHDLGKIGIPDQILQKNGPLTDEEYKIIKQHPLISVRIIEPLPIFDGELQIIRHHHERYDGGGYPDSLSEKEIPFGARILALADSFDAITSDRVYRKARLYSDAKDEIVRCSGSQFDPEVVEAFLVAYEKYAGQWPLAAVVTV